MARSMSVNAMAADIMVKYDHNRSGEIDLTRPDGIINKLKNPDERARSKTNVSAIGDSVNISTAVYTMDRLFYAADKNNDKKVTQDEIKAVLTSYDKDGDSQFKSRGFFGWLTRKPKQDLDNFNQDYKERTTNYGSINI